MKIISWNVNGIRACVKKGLLEFLKKDNADIYCFQEIKLSEKDADPIKELFSENLPKYHQFWHYATRRGGYSGLLVLSKKKPTETKVDSGDEGRILHLEFNELDLLNVYFPHTGRSLEKLDHKMNFNNEFLAQMQNLKKPTILAGDFNVAHTELDIERFKQNRGNAGFTDEERNWFSKLLKTGFIDTFRYFHPEERKYTWWLQMFDARERNVGWRIDYFLVTRNLEKKLISADILTEVFGSDHCPVELVLN
ncbi:exodeoxyribonuclease III [Patescibacteria group bacterium]